MLNTIRNRFGLLAATGGHERAAPGRSEPARAAHGSGGGDRRAAYRRGVVTFVALAVLTILEFVVATTIGSLVLLFIAALIKAAIILQYFMHLGHVWEEVEEVSE